ncbi:MAG TPA: DUF4864 domain-containing protein [Allosphingosinicella sp.]|jgi:hypothetical protein|nr:DUF4864 domain-containing protein [Allosphingosinicella sp.]
MDTLDTTAPKRRWRVWHFILIGVVAVAALAAGIVILVFSLTGPVVAVADTFMGALRDSDYGRAFSQSAPALQRELGTAEGYRSGIGPYRPASWSWSQRSIRNGVGRVSGSVTYQNGANGSVQLTMRQTDDDWRVEGYSFN